METTSLTTSGISYDLPFDAYCRSPGMNISTLVEGMKSMSHLKAKLDGLTKKDSSAMAMGRAIHARCLEPDVYRSHYIVTCGCPAIIESKKSKNCGSQCGQRAVYYNAFDGTYVCGTHKPKGAEIDPHVLDEDEAMRVEQCAQSLASHPVCKLLKLRGGFEATVRTIIDGIECKGRLDKEIHKTDKLNATVVDLKKVRVGRCDDESISKDILDYHYDVKAAWYKDIAEKETNNPHDFVWIFIEDGPPYAINSIQMDDATYAIGRAKWQKLFSDYKECLKTGIWPGISNKIKMGGLPNFEKKKWGFSDRG